MYVPALPVVRDVEEIEPPFNLSLPELRMPELSKAVADMLDVIPSDHRIRYVLHGKRKELCIGPGLDDRKDRVVVDPPRSTSTRLARPVTTGQHSNIFVSALLTVDRREIVLRSRHRAPRSTPNPLLF